jgi:hypothetical protein
MRKNILLAVVIFLSLFGQFCRLTPKLDKKDFEQVIINARIANEGYIRCMNYVVGWLSHHDSLSGLIPENLTGGKDVWNAYNSAADNYPFMVLTTYLLNKSMYNGVMLDMLNFERLHTSRVGTLPDSYSFKKQGFMYDSLKMDRIIFGSSEFIKDGLVPLTEYIGESPWKNRMMGMLKDLHKHSEVIKHMDEGEFGSFPVDEKNGELLQVLSRIYWMTRDTSYLNWAIKIGDYYLLSEENRLENQNRVRLRDHGCEIIGGLSELYLTVSKVLPEKKKEYERPLHELYDRVLLTGRNEDGMFYDVVNPKTSAIINDEIVDCWGYLYDSYYTVYLIDSTNYYLNEIRRAMSVLNEKYRNFNWENHGSDGFADAIESAINLYNRLPQTSVAEWIDSEIKNMWAIQKSDGVIEGTHADGNFTRTTIMYCFWKTQGVTMYPWRKDLVYGASKSGDTLRIFVSVSEDWQGKLMFDKVRHEDNFHLPVDYPRINQFPEWVTVNREDKYRLISSSSGEHIFTGGKLAEGICFSIKANKPLYIEMVKY